jgi:hypothetical protein
LSGQGQQAAIKIALAMGRAASDAQTVMIEEPENHLSHTNLNKLLARIDDVAGNEQRCETWRYAPCGAVFVMRVWPLGGVGRM